MPTHHQRRLSSWALGEALPLWPQKGAGQGAVPSTPYACQVPYTCQLPPFMYPGTPPVSEGSQLAAATLREGGRWTEDGKRGRNRGGVPYRSEQ